MESDFIVSGAVAVAEDHRSISNGLLISAFRHTIQIRLNRAFSRHDGFRVLFSVPTGWEAGKDAWLSFI